MPFRFRTASAVAAYVFLSTLAGAAFAGSTTRTFPAAKITRVNISNSFGHVDVRASHGKTSKVTITRRDEEKHCVVSVGLDNGQLEIAVLKRGLMSGPCNVNMRLDVPASSGIEVSSRGGAHTVSGIEGPLRFAVEDGSIDVQGAVTDLQVKMTTGQLKAVGLVAGGKIDLNDGSAFLSYAKTPVSGRLEVVSRQGDISIALPHSAVLNAETQAAGGAVQNDFVSVVGAPFNLKVNAEHGNVNITKSSKSGA